MRSLALAATVATAALAALTACGPAAAPPATADPTPATPRTVATTTPAVTTTSTVDPHAALDGRAKAALVGVTGYGSLGYGDGTDTPIPAGRPTTDVCNKPLAVDTAGYRAGAARQWSKPRAVVVVAVYGYDDARANDAINQIRTAATSCTTYTSTSPDGASTYTMDAPITVGPFYGTDSSYGYCLHRSQGTTTTVGCVGYIAVSNLLSVVSIGYDSPITADAYAELLELTDVAAKALAAS